ncbi:MAG: thiamine pyrophosphate-dependent enzyme, partial [Candidatus Eiseniibacteriota bacterium]
MQATAERVDDAVVAERSFALDAYRRMHFTRQFEKLCFDLSALQPPAIAGSIHLCAGQEAVPVGALAALEGRDRVVATYRGHGWALECGVTPYEALAEICQRADGINGGRAGSPLMMAPGRGFIGENSIVGAGVPIAAGVAMAQQVQATGGVTLVSFGDGAMNQGSLHEGFVFAVARKLPVIFVLEHNGWSEMTPLSRIVPLERLARRAGGYPMPGVTIDGADPLAVRETLRLAVERARAGEGPSLIECRVPRLWGHYNRDIEHYRSKEDRAAAEKRDPIAALEQRLVSHGAASADMLASIRTENEASLARLKDMVLAAPPPDPATATQHVIAPTAAPRSNEPPAPEAVKSLTYIQAVNEALRLELERRPELLVYGEDCGGAGGIFGATRNLQREFGEARVFDTPIAEAAILGSAVGAALGGLRPVVEIMWADFMLVALDQIVNQAANIRYVTRGAASAPLVVRTQQGATPGSCAQHSQCLEALLFHIPGIKLGLPSNAQDAHDMLRAAIADPDPVVIVEARALYQRKADVRTGGAVEAAASARWLRPAKDVAIVAWGTAVELALEAATQLQAEGIQAGVLDLRWLKPLDEAALDAAVETSGGRIVVVHEANVTGGVGAEIAASLAERHGGRLKHP